MSIPVHIIYTDQMQLCIICTSVLRNRRILYSAYAYMRATRVLQRLTDKIVAFIMHLMVTFPRGAGIKNFRLFEFPKYEKNEKKETCPTLLLIYIPV